MVVCLCRRRTLPQRTPFPCIAGSPLPRLRQRVSGAHGVEAVRMLRGVVGSVFRSRVHVVLAVRCKLTRWPLSRLLGSAAPTLDARLVVAAMGEGGTERGDGDCRHGPLRALPTLGRGATAAPVGSIYERLYHRGTWLCDRGGVKPKCAWGQIE